jgi:hypothetical protein
MAETFASVSVSASGASLSEALDALSQAVQDELSEPDGSQKRIQKRKVRHARTDELVTAACRHRDALLGAGVVRRHRPGSTVREFLNRRG